MQIIDTHCHLIDESFVDEVDIIIQRAIDAGVGKMILACCDESEITPIRDLCKRYPNILYPTIGIHPENIANDINRQSAIISKVLSEDATGFCAIGEVGIDLHWDKSRLNDQISILTTQANMALEYDLPLILHIRDAMPEFLTLLKDTLYNNARTREKRLRGILHCYSGTTEEAEEAMNYGEFLIGIGGTLTYKKSQVPQIALSIGLDRIVLETDAPYLAPVPKRGKRNEPSFITHTCSYLADLFGCTSDYIAEITSNNAKTMLNL